MWGSIVWDGYCGQLWQNRTDYFLRISHEISRESHSELWDTFVCQWHLKHLPCWAWWCTPEILALRTSWHDQEFKLLLSYGVSLKQLVYKRPRHKTKRTRACLDSPWAVGLHLSFGVELECCWCYWVWLYLMFPFPSLWLWAWNRSRRKNQDTRFFHHVSIVWRSLHQTTKLELCVCDRALQEVLPSTNEYWISLPPKIPRVCKHERTPIKAVLLPCALCCTCGGVWLRAFHW